MAGLLDFIGTPEGQGLLSAAFGGLAGARRGAPLNSIGGAGLAGLSGYIGANQRNLDLAQMQKKNQLTDAQIADMSSQASLRQQQNARLQQSMDLGRQLWGSNDPTQPTPTTAGASTSDASSPSPYAPTATSSGIGASSMPTFSPLTPSSPPNGSAPMGATPGLSAVPVAGSRLSRMTVDQITGLIAAGALPSEAMSAWKLAKFGEPLQPGTYTQTVDGQQRFNVDPKVGLTVNNGVISKAPGSGAISALAGETTAAQEGAKSRFDTVSVPMSDGSTRLMSRAQFLAANGAGGGGGGGGGLRSTAPVGVSATPNAGQLSTDAPVLGATPNAAQVATQEATKAKLIAQATAPVTFNSDVQKTSHANNAANLNSLADTVREESDIVARNARLMPLLDTTKLGGFGAEGKAQFANDLANSTLLANVPGIKNLTTALAGGDPATVKTIENQLSTAAITNMLDALQKEGKPNRAILAMLAPAQESIRSGNATLKQVFDTQNKIYNYHKDQLDNQTSLMDSPTYNPIKFPSQVANFRTNLIEHQSTPTSVPTSAAATDVDIAHTALIHNMTPAQVRAKLGIK